MNHLAIAPACLLLLLPVALVGQSDVVRTSFGVTTHEGVVLGLGPDYSARFETDGVTFTALLGERLAAPATLRFKLTSIRRGGANVFERDGGIAPVTVGNQVRYLHDDNVVETYDVRQDGIEQSFVFAQRPTGTGDLVVRGEITTDLPLAEIDTDGARFELAGAGGVAFGAVTGVDAEGARRRGSLCFDGRHLELSLPASFVDSAAYPLTLDPLIGSSFLIANQIGLEDVKPSIAYDESTQHYLLVWHAVVSTLVAETRAQLVSDTGPIGAPFLLDTFSDSFVRPAVANINQRNRFVVAWSRNLAEVRVAAVNASNGAISSSVAWYYNLPTIVGLALGGDSRTPLTAPADNAMLIVTRQFGFPGADRGLVQIPATGAPVLGPPTSIALQTSSVSAPAITKHAGSQGRWMFTFTDRDSGPPGAARIRCDVVSTSGSLCDSVVLPIGPGTGFSDLQASGVATVDGSSFLIAYEDAQTVQLRRITYSGPCGSTMVVTPPFGVPTTGINEHPELDCARDKWLLAWNNTPTTSTISDVHVMGIGLQGGQGAATLVQTSSSAQIDPAVASKWSGGDSASDEALVVWQSSGIRGRSWRATGTGMVTNLGGLCGFTGFTDIATYSGTPVIGTTFTVNLLAPTAPVIALLVGFSSTPVACGPCTIGSSADIVIGGSGPVPVVVPLDANLIGFELFTQWLQWRPSGCPLLPDFGFSNTLKFTIAE